MPVLCQEYMPFFCLPLSSQPRLNLLSTQQQGRAHSMWRGPPSPPRSPKHRGQGERGAGAEEVESDYSMANRKMA